MMDKINHFIRTRSALLLIAFLLALSSAFAQVDKGGDGSGGGKGGDNGGGTGGGSGSGSGSGTGTGGGAELIIKLPNPNIITPVPVADPFKYDLDRMGSMNVTKLPPGGDAKIDISKVPMAPAKSGKAYHYQQNDAMTHPSLKKGGASILNETMNCSAIDLLPRKIRMAPDAPKKKGPTIMSTFTVTNLNDAGAGSLRQAIIDANTNPGADNINFAVTGLILLTTGEMAITDNVTITGPGANQVTISGSNASRIMNVGGGVTASVSGLTFINGNTNVFGGAAIFTNGGSTVTVDLCAFIGNVCTDPTNGGGAIHSFGVITISNSTFTSNSHPQLGGAVGINCGGSGTIVNCTFVNNSCPNGGAVSNASFCGGTSTLNLIACTLVGNTTGFANVGQGAGSIAVGTYRNTIFANTGSNVMVFSSGGGNGTPTSLGYNISSDGTGLLTGTGDQPNTNPKIGPLQNNGGPLPTCAPLPGSPAIDKGGSVAATTDARGYARVQDISAIPNATGGNGTDIGAVEVKKWIVNVTNDLADATPPGDGVADVDLITPGLQTSLRSALDECNAYADFDVIEFAIGATGSIQTIALTNALPGILQSVSIDGWSQGVAGYTGPPLVEVDGGATLNVFGFVFSNVPDCTIRGLAINNFPQNAGNGIAIGVFGAGAVRTWIYGNFIGLHPNGTTLKGNGQLGIWLGGGSSQTVVGSNADGVNDAAERNVIVDSKTREGILIFQSNNNTVAGNYIGTNPAGTAAMGNQWVGINVQAASNNTIGGTVPAARNLISGNRGGGIYVQQNSSSNVVAGNYIGLDAAGSGVIANLGDGINVTGLSVSNTFGGSTAAARNIISGNNGDGIEINTVGSTGNLIQGNYIGTDATGSLARGNTQHGVHLLNANANTVGGSAAGARNILSANGFAGLAFEGTSTSGNVAQGNYIGLDQSGTNALGNAQGGVFFIIGATSNTLGGAVAGMRNVISSNAADGVILSGGAVNNIIQGNYIGTDQAGLLARPNSANGVSFNGAGNANTVGGPVAGAGNLISGNAQCGISIVNTNSALIQGNLIGTNPAGTAALANGQRGIILTNANSNTIGGTALPARNLISGNSLEGIFVNGASANIIQGNYVGTDITGNLALPDGGTAAFLIQGASTGNIVGGTTATGRNDFFHPIYTVYLVGAGPSANTIAGNYVNLNSTGTALVGTNSYGILLNVTGAGNIIGGAAAGAGNIVAGSVVGIRNFGTLGTLIKGNSVGLNATGTAGLAGVSHGIWIDNGSSGVLVGGSTLAERNLLANGTGAGMVFDGPATQGNTVQGNSIGTDISGVISLPFGFDGIHFQNSAYNTLVGGGSAAAGNRVWNNSNTNGIGGVFLNPGSSGIQIRGNSIYNNVGLGIKLYTGIFTPLANDACDGDGGANTLQNYPVLTSVIPSGGNIIVNGTLNSTAGQSYTLDFYSNPVNGQDPSGYGEGQTFLGSTTVTTNASCTGNFSVTLPYSGASCGAITATATNSAGNTSEFSKFMPVDATPPTITVCPSNVSVEADATCNGAIVTYPPAVATDNCPYPLTITYSQASGTYFPVGDTPVTVTVTDAANNVKTCTFTVHVEQRPIISPASNTVAIDFSCKLYPPYTKYLKINNTGGHFGGGQMSWTASTSASEITLSPTTGLEGQNLGITVDPTGLSFGTYTRTITLTAKNNVTNSPACNSPYTETVNITIELAVSGSQTKSVPVGSFVQFTDGNGAVMAEVKSNSTAISSFTVNWFPCTYPNGMYRWRYIKRYFTFASNAGSHNLDVKLYYTDEEMFGISHPDWLTIRQQPVPGGSWVDLGGTSDWLNNRVVGSGVSNINGVFGLAHIWTPKAMNLTIVSATFDRTSRHSVIQWRSPIITTKDGFTLERTTDPQGQNWDIVGSVPFSGNGEYGFSEKISENGKYYYRLTAMDKEGEWYESEPVMIEAADAPISWALDQNYPNPFNPSTAIQYQIAEPGKTTVKVYDMYWREVATLVNAEQAAGRYQVTFDANNLPSGVYYYKLESGAYAQVRKMNLMK